MALWRRDALRIARLATGVTVALFLLGGGFLAKPAAAPTPPATVTFPPSDLADKTNARDLGAYIYQVLGLPPPDQNRTVFSPWIASGYESSEPSLYCCLYAWGGRTIPVLNKTDVPFQTSTIWPQLTISYSASERFLQASLMGPFPDGPNGTDLRSLYERVEFVAMRLGFGAYPHDRTSWASSGVVSVDGEPVFVPTTVVSLHASYSGLPVAFGNELQVTFDMVHGWVIDLLVFPWFSAPTPAVTPGEAFTTALDHLNETVEGFDGPAWFDSGSVYFAFDAVRYALVYQVEAMYATYGRLPSGERRVVDSPYRVWVDAYDGAVVFSIEIPPHPGGSVPGDSSSSPQTFPPVLAGAAIAGAATGGAALLVRLRNRRKRV